MIRQIPNRLIGLSAAAWLLAASYGWAEDAAGHHGSGSLKEDLPFWGLVAFFGFLVALKFLGWKPLTSGMRDREAAERKLIADAESLRERTAEQLRKNKGMMESLDEKVRSALAEAQRDAETTRRDIRTIADGEAKLARQRADAEITRSWNQSLHDLFASTTERIAALAETRIRERLSAADQQQLIDAAVSDFVARK
jgi:F-type H+-transporting ATPase subunit b